MCSINACIVHGGERDIIHRPLSHVVMREFVRGPPRYHLAIRGIREQFVVLEQEFRTLE